MLQTQEETSPRSSIASSVEVDPHRQGIYQAHNVSRFWYKEKMSRDDGKQSFFLWSKCFEID